MKLPLEQLVRQAGVDENIPVVYWFHFLSKKKYTEKNVIVFADDVLSGCEHFFVKTEDKPIEPLHLAIMIAAENPQTHFFVLHGSFNLPADMPNLKWIHWGAQWAFHYFNDYRQVQAIQTKQPSTDTIWISLNGNRRMNRYLVAMYLLGADLEKHGYLSLDPTEIIFHESWETWLYWWTYNGRDEIFTAESKFNILRKGFNKIKRTQGFNVRHYSPDLTPKLNHVNFSENLIGLYTKTLVEIVNTTVWFPDEGAIVCEKYINSIYGKNLPLIIGAKNAVSAVRHLGFDVFDDLIDHSYDTINDPVIRLITALECNKKLLSDFDYAYHVWRTCESRMQANVEIAKQIENTIVSKMLEVVKQRILPFISYG